MHWCLGKFVLHFDCKSFLDVWPILPGIEGPGLSAQKNEPEALATAMQDSSRTFRR